jgi:hypothetical protein
LNSLCFSTLDFERLVSFEIELAVDVWEQNFKFLTSICFVIAVNVTAGFPFVIALCYFAIPRGT